MDVVGPKGFDLPAVGTGHLRQSEDAGEGIETRQREVKALLEVRVSFELACQAIDDMERGANDSDWSPLKDAARKIAFAEDRALFEGYASAGIQGIRQSTSHPVLPLPGDAKSYPGTLAHAVSQLRLAGVNGPYALILGAESYIAAYRRRRRH